MAKDDLMCLPPDDWRGETDEYGYDGECEVCGKVCNGRFCPRHNTCENKTHHLCEGGCSGVSISVGQKYCDECRDEWESWEREIEDRTQRQMKKYRKMN